MSWTGLGHTAIPHPRITTCIYCPRQLPAGFPLVGCIVEKNLELNPVTYAKALQRTATGSLRALYRPPRTVHHCDFPEHLRSYKGHATIQKKAHRGGKGDTANPGQGHTPSSVLFPQHLAASFDDCQRTGNVAHTCCIFH